MARQTHLQAIISAVDRLSPALNKIGANTARTKAMLTALGGVNFARLRGVTNMVGKSLTDVGNAARNASQQLLPLVGLGGLGLAGLGVGFVAASRGAMAYSASIQDAVDVTGVGFEELQKLQGAFRLGGVEAEAANEAIVKFNQGMANAAAGKDKSFAGLMTRLRIPIRDAKGEIRALTDVLPDLADAIEKNENPAVRTRMLMELFGKAGSKLAGTLGQGGKSLRDLMAELDKTGMVLSKSTGAALDQVDEQFGELGHQSRILWAEIVGRGSPALLKLVERMRGWLSANRELLQQRIGAVVERVAKAFTEWIDGEGFEKLIAQMKLAWTVLGEFVDRLGGLGNVLKLLGALILAGPLASLVSLGGAIGRLGLVLVPLLGKGLVMMLGPLGKLFAVLKAGRVVMLGMSLTLGQVALAAAPFLLAAAAIAAVAYLIWRNWDKVGPYLAGVWERIKATATVAWNVLRFLWSWSPLGIVVNNWGAIMSWLGVFWDQLKGVVQAGLALVDGLLASWGVYDVIRRVWEPIVSFFGTVWDKVRGFVEPIIGIAGRVVGALGGAIGGAVGRQFGAQASGLDYGPRLAAAPTPLIQAGAMQASAQVRGDMRVRFENAPPGMRVDPGKTSTPGLAFSPDVGYRSMGGIG